MQLTFLINNLDPVVNKVKAINGAADDGSPGILKLNAGRFFCPSSEIKNFFFEFLTSILAFIAVKRFSV